MALTTRDLAQLEKAKMTEGQQAGDHPADPSFQPPVASVKLPSLGKVYPPENPLFGCDSIDVRAMSAREEDIMSSPSLIKKGTVLSTLMKACITNRLLDPEKMIVGDRNAVLVSIRINAYGPEYEVNVTCPNCGEQTEHTFDLSKLLLKTLDVEPVGGPGNNLFDYTLPVSKRKVQFKLMDADSVTKLDKDLEASRKATPGGAEPAVTARLLSQIVSLEGADAKNMSKSIQNLAARDARALRKHMDEIAPGVNMEQEYECVSCGKESVVDVPIGTEFFWPADVR